MEGNFVDIATRHGGGIEVALIWNRDDESLVVFAYDAQTTEEVLIAVSGEEATEVYHHPFAYAHRSMIAAKEHGSGLSAALLLPG